MASGKEGKRSRASARHGREGWKTWMADNQMAKAKSKMVRDWIPVMIEEMVFDHTTSEEIVLSSPDGFKSHISELRSHPGSSWGYLVVSRIEGDRTPPTKTAKKARLGRPKLGPVDRHPRPGDPDLDKGAAALLPLDVDHSGIPVKDLDENDDPYSRLLDDCGRVLATYDYVRTKNGSPALDVRKPNGKGATDNLRRKTIDVSPGISRAFQLMIEDGKVEEARTILEKLQPILATEIERTFPLGKIVACGWHCNSGMPEKPGILHLDVWLHSTELRNEIIGKKGKVRLLRTWNANGLDHGGPGPGICAWDRHMRALGEDMERLAPGRCFEVRDSMERKESRAIRLKRPGTANRDVRLHRLFDDLVGAALPDDYLKRGMTAYREHLLEVYANGEPKFEAVIADPAKHARKRERILRALLNLRARRSALSRQKDQLATDAESQKARLGESRSNLAKRLLARRVETKKQRSQIADQSAAVSEKQAQLDERDQKLNQNEKILKANEEKLKGQAEVLRSGRAALAQLERDLRGNVEYDGLVKARQLFFGPDVTPPRAKTVEGLAPEVRSDILHYADRRANRIANEKLSAVYARLCPVTPDISRTRTLDEIIQQIENDTLAVRNGAVLAAWKKVLGILAPGQEVRGKTPGELEGEVRNSLSTKISHALKSIMTVLGQPVHQEQIALDALEEQVISAANSFKGAAEHAALANVWNDMELLDGREGDPNKIGTARLKELITETAKAMRNGASAASQHARHRMVELIIGSAGIKLALGRAVDPVEIASAELRDMKAVRDITKALLWSSEELKVVPLGSDTAKLLSKLKDLIPEPKEERNPSEQTQSKTVQDKQIGDDPKI